MMIIFPIAPEMILSIPFMNKLSDSSIIIKGNVRPGNASNTPENARTMPPNMILAILDPFVWSAREIPVATRPAPYMNTNIMTNQINETNATIG